MIEKNILIPASGRGSRFVEAGYAVPKPFINIHGKPMIAHVIDNISDPWDRVFILLRAEHFHYIEESGLYKRKNLAFIAVPEVTEGAACTALLARRFIDSSIPLVIANSDQVIKYNKHAWNMTISDDMWDGTIMTIHRDGPQYSYSRDVGGRVVEVAEKQVISKHATTGVYHFSRGNLFVQAADKMISEDKRHNGEFYICPTYNELVGKYKIRNFMVEENYNLGTPKDLEENRDKI
jgi:dTDP-glucose pyrophosphorylase